jgi:hypothetical protein
MPKEYINDESYGRYALLDSSDQEEPTRHLISDAALKITWGRDTETVQLAVVTDDDRDGMESQHVTLDRKGLNALIRLARTARDSAYGKDE